MEERLQKILARAGLGSRRACEELIQQGRVAVNGQTARLGQKADPARDRITVDGQPVRLRQQHTYIALHKPAGVVCTVRDPQGRPTVLDLVPARPGVRLWPAGRLDTDSEGLVLLTDDGALTHQLTHPRFGHEKEYRVLVVHKPDQATLDRWSQGLVLDGRRTAPARVRLLQQEDQNTWWLVVVLREGRKRQIRQMMETLGHPVRRLIRLRIGPVHLGDLAPGQWRYLTRREIQSLQRLAPR